MFLAYTILLYTGFLLTSQTELKLLLSTTVALPQHPSSMESHRDLFWALFFLSCTLHLSLMLSTATLSFITLLLTTLSCRNLPRHNSLMNWLSPFIHDVKSQSWKTHSKLKLNDDKTDQYWSYIHPGFRMSVIPLPDSLVVEPENSTVCFSQSAKN